MEATATVKINPGYCLVDGEKQHFPGDLVELPEKDAADLIDRSIVALAKEDEPAGDEGIIAKTPDLDDMTVKELKALLDKLGIEYDSNDRKPDLIKLVADNTAEPPIEG